MAMSQGKNDINLYWKDKKHKKEKLLFPTVFTFLSTLRVSTGVHCHTGVCVLFLPYTKSHSTKPPKGAVVTHHTVHKQNSTTI